MTDTTVWRRRILKLMDERGMSHKTLAEKMGVTPGYVSQILSENATRGIGRKTLIKLADIFHVPIDALLRDEESVGPFSAVSQPNQKVPVISWSKVSGWTQSSARYLAGQAEELVSFDCDDPNAFAIRLPDGELEPKFSAGDVLVVSPAAVPQNNDYGLITYDDMIKVRRIAVRDGMAIMTTERGEIETKSEKNIRIIGKIVGRISRL